MPTMTVQEWAAEYKLINEAEREDLKRRLPHEPVEESVRSYFLCKLVIALSGSADEPEELWKSRPTCRARTSSTFGPYPT
jgi:hypothetical protein